MAITLGNSRLWHRYPPRPGLSHLRYPNPKFRLFLLEKSPSHVTALMGLRFVKSRGLPGRRTITPFNIISAPARL